MLALGSLFIVGSIIMAAYTNFSNNSLMEECVRARDAYVEGGGFLNLKDFWRKEGYEHKYGIKYDSFLNYARADKTKRTPLYTRPG